MERERFSVQVMESFSYQSLMWDAALAAKNKPIGEYDPRLLRFQLTFKNMLPRRR